MVTSWALASEISEVLRRARLRRYGIDERDVQDMLFLLAPFLPSVEMTVPLRDPDDVAAVTTAILGKAQAIVTGERDLLDDQTLTQWLAERKVDVLTPAALMDRLND